MSFFAYSLLTAVISVILSESSAVLLKNSLAETG